jgi:hypothetical protein
MTGDRCVPEMPAVGTSLTSTSTAYIVDFSIVDQNGSLCSGFSLARQVSGPTSKLLYNGTLIADLLNARGNFCAVVRLLHMSLLLLPAICARPPPPATWAASPPLLLLPLIGQLTLSLR